MIAKTKEHQRLEEIAKLWKPGYWVSKRNKLAVQWQGAPINENMQRLLQYKHPDISYAEMEAVLYDIFTYQASRMKVKPGPFSSDATDSEGNDILMFTEFPFYECGPEYARYSPNREKPLGIERRKETKRESRHYGTKYLAYIHPLKPETIRELPLLEHYGMLWSEEVRFPNAHIELKTVSYSPSQIRDFLEIFHDLIDNGVWGDPNNDHITFLRASGLKLKKTKCGPDYAFKGKASVRHGPSIKLVVDPVVLAELRDVYHDIEGTIVREEFKKTFTVRGGIPFQAIKDFSLNPAYFKS